MNCTANCCIHQLVVCTCGTRNNADNVYYIAFDGTTNRYIRVYCSPNTGNSLWCMFCYHLQNKHWSRRKQWCIGFNFLRTTWSVCPNYIHCLTMSSVTGFACFELVISVVSGLFPNTCLPFDEPFDENVEHRDDLRPFDYWMLNTCYIVFVTFTPPLSVILIFLLSVLYGSQFRQNIFNSILEIFFPVVCFHSVRAS